MARPKAQKVASLREALTSEATLRKLTEKLPGFSRASFLASLFEEIGGEKEFAKIVAREIKNGKTGSVALQRNLDGVMRVLNWHSNDQHQVPVEELSEAELLASIRATLPRLETALPEETPETLAPREGPVANPAPSEERFEE